LANKLVTLVRVLALAMCIIESTASASDNNAASTVEPATISISGVGQQASQMFTLTEGLSIFTMKHSGSSNFIVWLLDHNGNKVELLANVIGDFNGAKAVGISTSGDYILDITAHGPWTVDITQPRPQTAQSVPVSLIGKGQQVSQFFTLTPGLARFKLVHDGERNFIVWLLDLKGNKLELLANEIGKFDRSKATGINDGGIYCIDINADGDWKIDISQ